MEMLSTLGRVYTHQRSPKPLLVDASFCNGKTFIVTGSNSGVGFECAKHLIRLGSSRVILGVRSQERGDAALATIESETGVKGVGQVWLLEMSSYSSILRFVERVKRETERVDGVLLNAVAAQKDWEIREGLEGTVAVNVVGTLLLAVLLMPYMRQCAEILGTQPRLSIVTSGLAFTRQADLEKMNIENILHDVSDSKKWAINGVERYSLSKLLQVLATRRLAALAPVSKTAIVINYIDPGLCNTGLVRYADRTTKFQVAMMRAVLGQTAEWGSRNLLHGLVAGEESHGKYLTYCEIKENWVPDWVSNKDGQKWSERMWEEVAAELEGVQSGCVSKALVG